MKADNKSVIIITHKLHEVLEISDRVAILRKGEYIGTVDTCEATENSLTEMMVAEGGTEYCPFCSRKSGETTFCFPSDRL